MIRHPLSSTGSSGASSPASTVLWDAPTPCRSSRRTSLPWFGGTILAPVFVSPLGPTPTRGQEVSWTGTSRAAREEWKRQGLPGSWGTRMYVPCSPTPAGPPRQAIAACWCCLPHFQRRRLPRTRCFRGSITRPAHSLSTLRSGGLLHLHARLATGCWPSFTGRDWLPAGSHCKV